MVKSIFPSYFLLCLCFCFGNVSAQDAVANFVVEFNVTGNNPSVNKEDGDFMSYAYKGQKMSMVLINKMIDLHMIFDDEKKEGLLLNTTQMGSVKVATKLTEEALTYDKIRLQIEPLEGTKRIKGYKCSGAVITLENKHIEVWYTPKLKPHPFEFEGYFFSDMDGFPLLMIETSKDGILTSKATKVSFDVEDNLFDQSIPEGYKNISFEKLNGAGRKQK